MTTVADPTAALAVGAILVWHRHARARRLQPHDIWRASVADRRDQRGTARAGSESAIGVVTGFSRWTDAIVMRVMDGLMSIPAILIAIALMALTRASHAERHRGDHDPRGIPRVVAPRALGRADHSRADLYRGSAIAAGTPALRLLLPPHPAEYGGADASYRHLHRASAIIIESS